LTQAFKGLLRAAEPDGREAVVKVALVSMPFAALDRPPLGVCLLQAVLRTRGVACDAHHLSLAFSARIGYDPYRLIGSALPFPALVGEWVFSACLFDHPPSGRDYVQDILRTRWRLSAPDVDAVLDARSKAPAFLDDMVISVPWRDYDVVAFSSFGAQNLAALALARRIKAAHPHVLIVFGGSNWHGVMGVELLRRFPFVDAAFLGEADESFPTFVASLNEPTSPVMRKIDGLALRRHGAVTTGPPPLPVSDLDSLPFPDFGDYYRMLAASGHDRLFVPALAAESSRGCWWAAAKPCMFCGLNGPARRFRSKSPSRILREFRSITRRWRCSLLDLVDNIVSPTFLTGVLPELAARPLSVPLFIEVRPDVDRESLRLMGEANVTVQAGLESLSDEVLDLMHKGTSTLENIRLLKWCRAYGVCAFWNIIYGFPGETDEAYEDMADLLAAIRFLNPPDECGPLALERFSPYFEDPEGHGFANPRPATVYQYLYPLPEGALRNIAPTFEFDYAPGREPASAVADLRSELAGWQREVDAGAPRLLLQADGTAVLVDDRGAGPPLEERLDVLDALVCSACDDICTREALDELVRVRLGNSIGGQLDRRLARLAERRLLVGRGDRYLSLTVSTALKGEVL
jgi:ribosomal peptide maturation radical SAM protein 1